MTVPKPIPSRHGVYHVVIAGQTPPSEVQEEFYQARKKLGDEAKNFRPASSAR
jgi:hypothetical protein